MPGFKNTTKPQGKKTKAAVDKNNKAIAQTLSGTDGAFGRVTKALGNSQFTVAFYDGKDMHELIGTPRGVFSAGGKKRVDISTDDIVLLDGTQYLKEAVARGNKLIVEIWAVFCKKDAQELFKAGRIHASIYIKDSAAATGAPKSAADVAASADLFDHGDGGDLDVDAI